MQRSREKKEREREGVEKERQQRGKGATRPPQPSLASFFLTLTALSFLPPSIHLLYVFSYFFFADSGTPRMRDSFDRIAGLGIALPDSYSCTTCGFSLIAWASAAWVMPLASLAVMMRFLSSEGTLGVFCLLASGCAFSQISF